MVHHPGGDDRVVAGEGAGDIFGALAAAQADLLLLDIDWVGAEAGQRPFPSSCGSAPRASGRRGRPPFPPAACQDRSARKEPASHSCLGAEFGDGQRSLMRRLPRHHGADALSVRISISRHAARGLDDVGGADAASPRRRRRAAWGSCPARRFHGQPFAEFGGGKAGDQAWTRPSDPRAGRARR